MLLWNVKPEMISIGPITLRWYGVLFACAFVYGLRFIRQEFSKEKLPAELPDRLLIYMMVGTIGGARLGHTLFYEPQVYLPDPLRILKVWEGGLASHGAAIGIILALWLFSKKYKAKVPFVWLLDRIAIPVAFAGFLIRLGNLFNSEILGRPADVPWAVVFTRIDQIPRHPTQLYESLAYLFVFLVIRLSYRKSEVRKRHGLIFGMFLIGIFAFRLLIEFFKENQVAFESGLAFNLGQLLSMPLIAVGAWMIFRANRKKELS